MASLTMYSGPENHHLMNSYIMNNDKMMLHRTLSSPEHSPQQIAIKVENDEQQYYSQHQVFQHQQQQHQHHQATPDLMRCKRRIHLGHLPSTSGKGSGPQPAAVARRNERERKRVKMVNEGFNTLRKHVPTSTKNKKMSKVDTLRSAVEYIKSLQQLLGEGTTSEASSSTGLDENSYPVGGQSSTGSPTPSMCSEASSPYAVMHGDEDDEFMEFTSWF